MSQVSLLGSLNHVEAPFIKVDIGRYTFGVWDKAVRTDGSFITQYPNLVKRLTINKINGAVNTYSLEMVYPVTQDGDPNFLDKVLSTVSDSREIRFSYGDFATPDYVYSNERALITSVESTPVMSSLSINYTIQAVSSTSLSSGAKYTFPARRSKPSTVIYELLYKSGDRYKLKELFPGMVSEELVNNRSFILSDDQEVDLQMKTGISILEYLIYLVSCMVSNSDVISSTKKKYIYTLNIAEDTEGELGGAYFRIKKINSSGGALSIPSAYVVDVNYQSSSIILNFEVKNVQNYSILYNYNRNVESADYGKRINDNGEIDYILAPALTSSTQLHKQTEADRTWWTKMTSFPITASLTIKGALKAQTLMSYVKVNVWFYGRKHVSSGYYLITSQQDSVSASGFRTTLGLLRIAGDEDDTIGMFGEEASKDKVTSSNANSSLPVSVKKSSL